MYSNLLDCIIKRIHAFPSARRRFCCASYKLCVSQVHILLFGWKKNQTNTSTLKITLGYAKLIYYNRRFKYISTEIRKSLLCTFTVVGSAAENLIESPEHNCFTALFLVFIETNLCVNGPS